MCLYSNPSIVPMDIVASCDPNMETIEREVTKAIPPSAVPSQLACLVSLSKDKRTKDRWINGT